MLGWSNSQHKHFAEKKVQTDDLLIYMERKCRFSPLMILWTLQHEIVSFYRDLSMYMYTCSCTILDLSQIIMPSKVRKRGQNKGSDKTVIGLTKKRKCQVNKPVPFLRKTPQEGEKDVFIYHYAFFHSLLFI